MEHQINSSLRNRIKTLLHSNICIITFKKSNSEERIMICTLLEQFLPPVSGEEKKTRKRNNESISVWDIETKDWRSFRYDSIVSMTITTSNIEVDVLKDTDDE